MRSMRQSPSRRARTMLRLSLLVVLLSHRIGTAYVTDTPSFADRLDKLYEKLERLTVAPKLEPSPEEKLYAKLERLNSLSPEKIDLTDEDEELLSAMQTWGRLSADQLDVVVKDLQRMKDEPDVELGERIADPEYGDGDDEFQEIPELPEVEYPNDKDWETEEESDSGTTVKPLNLGITPSAFTRIGSSYKHIVVSAVDPIAATNERPRVLDDSSMTAMARRQLRRDALANMAQVVHAGKCLVPQPRWLTVRQLAPAADTVYMPPCVQLHRCAPDAGCCNNEFEVCAPIDGKYVAIPFFLQKANGNMNEARMLFFNHTRCACVSRETLQSTVRTRIDRKQFDSREAMSAAARDLSSEGQNDWRMPTEEPKAEKEEVSTSQPQLRSSRCTCPAHFLANATEGGGCACVCEWAEAARRRDCMSLARGREHFGLRDRVCVEQGHCAPPACEYGAYDATGGQCPRRYRRYKLHGGRRYQPEKGLVV